jgi:2-polyprenyl-6-methoxyphenol hydroxylase-like FAD-dependent oxidoreductase
MTPILVVGAGPVGLTMASELSRFGVGVRIIDRNPHPTKTSRALVIWSRTLELMDRMGCTRTFLDAGLRAHGASMRAGQVVLGRPRFDDIASEYNFALMIPQRDTERLLIQHLRTLGVEVERQVELLSFVQRDECVETVLSHPDGRKETALTPWLIGCDGAHSTVRHGLNVEFRGSAQGDEWMIADVRVAGESAPAADEISIYFHRDGPFVVFPIPGDRARIIATRGKSDEAHPRPDPTIADVQSMIDQRAGGGFSASDPVWLTNFRINERKVAQYRHGRAFLAGDAAHIHSPAGGQGMNTGMQDAVNLAWKLALVVHQAANDSVLDSYSPERNAVGEMVLRNATLLTDVATLANPAAQAARNIAARFLLGFHAVQDEMASTMSEIDIAYRKSALSTGRHAGSRWAPRHYAGAPPGSGDSPKFVLYAADGNKAAALLGKFPALVEAVSRQTPDSYMHVVRPDGYVGLTAGSDDWNEVDSYLDRLT